VAARVATRASERARPAAIGKPPRRPAQPSMDMHMHMRMDMHMHRDMHMHMRMSCACTCTLLAMERSRTDQPCPHFLRSRSSTAPYQLPHSSPLMRT
jgi:hypothetical protein